MRSAIFVDAGYLFAEGGKLIAGREVKRHELALDAGRCIASLRELATKLSGGKELLRCYWYDGTRGVPTAQQRDLAKLADTKLRLGLLNSKGEQKGVDSLIVRDLITLSLNKGITDAVLITGDEDIRTGVIFAQEHGVRVHLMGIPTLGNGDGRASHNQSAWLFEEADTCSMLSAEHLSGWLRLADKGSASTGTGTEHKVSVGEEAGRDWTSAEEMESGDDAQPHPVVDYRDAVESFVQGLDDDKRAEAVQSWEVYRAGIPAHIDKPLMAHVGKSIDRPLDRELKRLIRLALVAKCKSNG